MNRIEQAIERTNANPNLQNLANEKLALTFEEHFEYQNLQALAHAQGKLNPEEAMLVYNALGETGSAANGNWASDTSKAEKVVITRLMAELMNWKLKLQTA